MALQLQLITMRLSFGGKRDLSNMLEFEFWCCVCEEKIIGSQLNQETPSDMLSPVSSSLTTVLTSVKVYKSPGENISRFTFPFKQFMPFVSTANLRAMQFGYWRVKVPMSRSFTKSLGLHTNALGTVLWGCIAVSGCETFSMFSFSNRTVCVCLRLMSCLSLCDGVRGAIPALFGVASRR